jgi:hypothetical protein
MIWHFVLCNEAKHQERIALAWGVHRRTNQPQAWIAETIGLHSAANVRHQVRRFQSRVKSGPQAASRRTLFHKLISLVNDC